MKKTIFAAVWFSAWCVGVLLGAAPAKLYAQTTCAALPSTNGLATATITLTQVGVHHVWFRLKAADGNPTMVMSVDGEGGTVCDVNISGSGAADTWIWVEAPSTFESSGGDTTVYLSGNKVGVGMDCFVVTPDASFAPTDKTGCTPPPDITAPTVAVTSPAAGTTVSGNVTLSANAADNEQVQSVQFKVDGVNVGAADTAPPYEVTWDSDQASDGDHTITATATDTSGNSTTSESVTVTVNNSPTPPQASDLRARWKFDEGNGSVANDATGNGHNGTLAGPAWTTGKAGGALDFDGSNDYVNLNKMDVGTNALTITAWINADSFTNYPRIISKAAGSSDDAHYWMISTAPSGGEKLRFRLKTGGSTTTLIADSGNLATGTWHHIAARYDGSTIKLYLDGDEVGSEIASGTIDTNPAVDAYIGANPVTGSHFDGRIDDVQIYDKALGILELRALAAGHEPSTDPGEEEDTVPPSVTITNNDNTTVTGSSVSIQVEATDDTAVSRVDILVDGEVVQTINEAPFVHNLNIRVPSMPNGDYTLTATAYDAANNHTTSSPKTVRVRHPDINRNGTVEIFDLSMLLARWTNTNDTIGDLNVDGSVGIFDLSILLSSWGN